MTPPPPSPKLFKDDFNSKSTEEHDELHLWLYDNTNLETIIQFVLDLGEHEAENLPKSFILEKGHYYDMYKGEVKDPLTAEYTQFLKLQILEKHVEMPLYGYHNFLLGIADCFLKVSLTYQVRLSDANNNYEFTEDTHNYHILCELKPRLNSISSTLGQIRVYKQILSKTEYLNEKSINAIILTFDPNTKYDTILIGEGIKVYRIRSGNDISVNGATS